MSCGASLAKFGVSEEALSSELPAEETSLADRLNSSFEICDCLCKLSYFLNCKLCRIMFGFCLEGRLRRYALNAGPNQVI